MTNQNIPDTIKAFAKSKDVYETVENIGGLFGLHIDQMGELDAEIRSVLLGINKSVDFTKNIAARLEVDGSLAKKITEEVNKQIFSILRTRIENTEPNSQESVYSIEQAGGFNIVPEAKEATNNLTESDKDRVLRDLENPNQNKEYAVAKDNAETATELSSDQFLTSNKPESVPPKQTPISIPEPIQKPAPKPIVETIPKPTPSPTPETVREPTPANIPNNIPKPEPVNSMPKRLNLMEEEKPPVLTKIKPPTLPPTPANLPTAPTPPTPPKVQIPKPATPKPTITAPLQPQPNQTKTQDMYREPI